MAKSNKTRYSLLGLLSFGPMTGYEIKKLIDRSIYYFWTDSYGHIYPLLKRMEKEGLVLKKSESPGGHQRNRFTITDKGRRELREWLKGPVAQESVRSEFLLKLFFGSQMSKREVIDMILAERKKHEALIEQYAEIEKSFANIKHKAKPFWFCTLNYGKQISKSILIWCDEAAKAFEKNACR